MKPNPFNIPLCILLACILSSCGGGGGGEDSLAGNACSDLNLRIANGDKCNLEQTPVVLVMGQTASGGVYTCTGTMVTLDDVLTAAHCIPSDAVELAVLTENDTFVASRNEITRLAIHPKATEVVSGVLVYDLAMITLSRITNAPPVPLGLSDPVLEGERLTAYGFGTDELGRDIFERGEQDLLRAGYMRVTGVSSLLIGASYDLTGSSTCPGDSGGPIVQKIDGVSSIVGITSFGTRDSCTTGSSVAFVNIQNPAIYEFILNYAPDVALR